MLHYVIDEYLEIYWLDPCGLAELIQVSACSRVDLFSSRLASLPADSHTLMQ